MAVARRIACLMTSPLDRSEAPGGRELDREIARAMGLVPCEAPKHTEEDRLWCWADPETPMSGGELPTYSKSLDVLVAGPEARLRAEGWRLTVWQNRTDYQASWIPPRVAVGGGATADDEPTARARAALAALQSLKAGAST